MQLTVKDIVSATGAELKGSAATDFPVTHLVIDSRSPLDSDGAMFCAITTAAASGYKYIPRMYDKGVRCFLTDRFDDELAEMMTDATFLKVDNIEAAIIRIAEEWRKHLNDTTFIGITGSVGKTVVKEMLYRALSGILAAGRSPRSWNSHIGVPLSITELTPADKVAIIEVGIDSDGEMSAMQPLVRPKIGIFTPVTAEHDDGFKSRHDKIYQKALLFSESEYVIYDAAIPGVAEILAVVCPKAKLIAIESDFNNRAVDEVLKILGVEPRPHCGDAVDDKITVHQGVNDCIILYDGFTPDYRSLAGALDFFCRRKTSNRSDTVVITDLFHAPDENLDTLYARCARLLKLAGIERVVGIGTEISDHRHFFVGAHNRFYTSAEAFLSSFDAEDYSGETILLFGEPREFMNQVRTLLEAPRHDTTLQVNLAALAANFNYYRSLTRPGTGMIAMVKASAYGFGAVEVAKTMQDRGAAYLAVAVVDEGVELRRNGITMPIVVLNPVTGNYKALFDYNLEPSVFSLKELEDLERAAGRAGIDRLKIHVKLDTGMHRVGFTEAEIPGLAVHIKNREAGKPEIEVVSVFSHLATADCLDMDDYTRGQLDTFARMSQELMDALGKKVLRHLLNTAGIMRFPEYDYDMVRLGIGLYGVSPLPGKTPLQTVASLMTTVVSLKQWPAGTTIGYGCRGVLTRPSVIATVPIGYADGLNRHFSRGNASFMIRGVECPTVGNICMDQCMVDVTDVPGVAVGDEVEVFGQHIPVERLAETLDTIPYEIFTSVAPRVKRIYYRR